MTQHDDTKPNYDLLGAIFGVSSQEEWDDEFSNTHRQQREERERAEQGPTAEQQAEAERVADFEQEIAAVADVELVFPQNLNKGQFASRYAKESGLDRGMVFEADLCNLDDVRRNDSYYQALQQVREQVPGLYQIIMTRKSREWSDRGPFGNDWGE